MRNKPVFMLLTLVSIMPFNRWYLGESAILRACTLNYFCTGWVKDMLSSGKVFWRVFVAYGFSLVGGICCVHVVIVSCKLRQG